MTFIRIMCHLPARFMRRVISHTVGLSLSLKTSHCDVFTSLRSARSPSSPYPLAKKKRHPVERMTCVCITCNLPARFMRRVISHTVGLSLSLKTSHCDVFTSLRSARSPSSPVILTLVPKKKRHPVERMTCVCIMCRLTARFMRRVK